MAVTPLPFLDRTAATFKTDTDKFFGQQLPQFSVDVNQVATAADASATAASASKNAAATSATNAANSATGAANSATAANTSKNNAATSETNAANSATAANTSKNAAAGSATAAATSATNAANSATAAQAAADSIGNGPVTSVNGKTGVVSLVKADIGLPLVDNVSVVAAGIGKAPLISDNPNLDSVLLTNGWYSCGPNTVMTRPPGQDRGIVLISGRAFQADSRCTQLWFTEGETRAFIRRSVGGVWSEWVELTIPAVSGNARKPLTPGDAATEPSWSDTLSIPRYIDKMITYGTSAATFALNISRATVFDITLSVNTTFSLTNMPSLSGEESLTLVVRVRQAAAPKTIAWFAGITWLTPGGLVPPTPGANQIIEYILSTTGTGTTWVGRVGASS